MKHKNNLTTAHSRSVVLREQCTKGRKSDSSVGPNNLLFSFGDEIYLLATAHWPNSPGLEVYLLKVECLILVLILPQNKVSVILVL